MNYSPCPCSYVLWKRRRLHPAVQKAYISHWEQQNCRSDPFPSVRGGSGRRCERDWQTGERPVTPDWPVIVVSRTLGTVFFIPASVFSTQPTKHSKWGFRRLTGLSLPPHGAQLPSERGDVSRVFFTDTLSLSPSLHLCPLHSLFGSLFPVFKIYDILWFNNLIAFKTCIIRT